MEDNALKHLEAIKQDIRDEVKKRIEQRDRYSVQLTIALGALVAIAFGPTGFGKALVAAPLVSIYFTVLILYSYRIHRILARYLRENIEPELARLCGISPEMEWENYYAAHAVPGIRQIFFICALWIVCLASLLYLWLAQNTQGEFTVVLIGASVVYSAAVLLITCAFWRT